MNIFKNKIYLPASRLCNSPFIFGGFFEDFIKRRVDFKIWYDLNKPKHKNICAVFMFGYHYETPPRMEYAKEQIAEIRKIFPDLKMYFLANSEIEKKNFEAIGECAEFCSQNAFLHESRYRVTSAKKIYDALYFARITPIKRHALALEIPKLLLIGDYFDRESKYAEGILNSRRPDTTWIRKVQGLFAWYYINKAKLGLCLSPEEGAMYVCAEYGLCGLPVITSKCLGGREYSLDPKYTFITPTDQPTATEIAELVEKVNQMNFDAKQIRLATIAVLNEHRARYANFVKKIFADCNEGDEKSLAMMLKFPHKFGVRCRILPIFKMLRTLQFKKQ